MPLHKQLPADGSCQQLPRDGRAAISDECFLATIPCGSRLTTSQAPSTRPANCIKHGAGASAGGGARGSRFASANRGRSTTPHKLQPVELEAGVFAEGGHAPAPPQEPREGAYGGRLIPGAHGPPMPLRPDTSCMTQENLTIA